MSASGSTPSAAVTGPPPEGDVSPPPLVALVTFYPRWCFSAFSPELETSHCNVFAHVAPLPGATVRIKDAVAHLNTRDAVLSGEVNIDGLIGIRLTSGPAASWAGSIFLDQSHIVGVGAGEGGRRRHGGRC